MTYCVCVVVIFFNFHLFSTHSSYCVKSCLQIFVSLHVCLPSDFAFILCLLQRTNIQSKYNFNYACLSCMQPDGCIWQTLNIIMTLFRNVELKSFIPAIVVSTIDLLCHTPLSMALTLTQGGMFSLKQACFFSLFHSSQQVLIKLDMR